jgi:hypothetical protein
MHTAHHELSVKLFPEALRRLGLTLLSLWVWVRYYRSPGAILATRSTNYFVHPVAKVARADLYVEHDFLRCIIC